MDPTGHSFWTYIGKIIMGAIIGAAIGATVAAATRQDVGQGALTGAISGAIFAAVGGLGLQGIYHTVGHILAGAASGAANGAVTGGDVGMNALVGGVSAGASEYLGNNVSFLKDVPGKGPTVYLTNMLRRAFIGSVIGGSVSAATGGSFGRGAALGAQTSAIAYAANEAMEHGTELAQKALNSDQNPGPTKDINSNSVKNNSVGEKSRKAVGWPYTAKSWFNKIVLTGIGGGLVKYGWNPIVRSIGWVMVSIAAASSIYSIYKIPDKAQNIANDIYRESGMEEHYREIDEAGREFEEMNNR